MVRRADTTSFTVHVLKMAKKAAGAGGRMARAAMQTVVLDTCVTTDRRAVTARHEMETKAAVIDVQKARRMAMALEVNVVLAPTARRRGAGPPREGETRPPSTTAKRPPRWARPPEVTVAPAPPPRRPRQDPVQINHIRPAHPRNQQKTKATQNRMPPFDLSS